MLLRFAVLICDLFWFCEGQMVNVVVNENPRLLIGFIQK